MGTIFNQITAEISLEFQQNFRNFIDVENESSLFQRICDTTGVILVQNGASKKLLGPWNSIKYAHDLLNGFVLFKSFKDRMECAENEKLNIGQGKIDRVQKSNVLPTHEMQALNIGIDEKRTEPMANVLDRSETSGTVNNSGAEKMRQDGDIFATEETVDWFNDTCNRRRHRMFGCDECSYVGVHRRHLVDHKYRMHQRPYRCSTCLRGFGLWKDLKRHQKGKFDCARFSHRRERGRGRGRGRRCLWHTHLLENSGDERKIDAENDSNPAVNLFNLEENAIPKTGSSEVVQVDPSQACKMVQDFTSEIKLSNSHLRAPSSSSVNLNPTRDQRDNSRCHREIHAQEETSPKETFTDTGEIQMIIKEEVISDSELNDTIADLQNQSNSQVQEIAGASAQGATPTLQENIEGSVHMWQGYSAPKENLSDEYNVINLLNYGAQKGMRNKFQCKHCSFCVFRKQQIEDHIRRVHIRQFRCDICGATFGLLKDLNRHYRKTHKIMIESQRRGRKPQCDFSTYSTDNDPDSFVT